MNTIPLTFDENLCNCTVLGGEKTDIAFDDNVNQEAISVLLLSRNAGNFKSQCIENLLACGFYHVISIENSKDNFKVEPLAKKFPGVRFIVPLEEVTVGDMINLGMAECKTPYLFVLWDDFVIKSPLITELLMAKIAATNALCFCPVYVNSVFQNVPVQMKPFIENKNFSVLPSQVVYDNTKTLFPFDFAGIYNREKFISVSGFDSTIKSAYWQLLDFACRSYLWGEKIITSPIFRISYQNKEPLYDSTLDISYFRFYLKNIAPVLKVDYAYIPINKFVMFHRNSIYSFGPAVSEFKRVRKWVSKNKFRFKTDMEKLISSWNTNDDDK